MEPYGQIIEDKKNLITVKKKGTAWQQLADCFNGSTGVKEKRDVAKACWKNSKTEAKKDVRVRDERCSSQEEGLRHREMMAEKINALIPQQVEPLRNPYDDDDGGVLDLLTSDSPREDGK